MKYKIHNCPSDIFGTLLHIDENPFKLEEDITIINSMVSHVKDQFKNYKVHPDKRTNEMRKGITTSHFLERPTGLGIYLMNHWREIENEIKEHSPNHILYHENKPPLRIEESIRMSFPGEDYQPHADIGKKLTCLIYLEPEISNPTYFHGVDCKGGELEISWKPWTGYMFMSSPASMHSYRNTYQHKRFIYMANLYTNEK